MDVTIKVDGIDDCLEFINSIPNLVDNSDFKQYIGENCVNVINKIANEKLIISNDYNSNNKIKILDNGVQIYNEVQNDNGTFYSLIIEYGSGTHAELEHIGTSPKFQESGFEYWYVPEEVAPKIANYSYKKIITKNGETLYMVFGQNPKHIYTDAAQEIANNLQKWSVEFIKNELDKL